MGIYVESPLDGEQIRAKTLPERRLLAKHIVLIQGFCDKHERKAIVFARFVSIAAVNYRTFFSFNVVGGLMWTFGLTTLGYSLGALIPDVDRYLLPIVLVIIVVSLLPSIFHIYQEHKSHRP